MAEANDTPATGLPIFDLVKLDNVCDEIPKDKLTAIGQRVIDEYEADKKTMADWMGRNEQARKLIDQKLEIKNEPWQGAANTKLPLVLNAAMRVSAEEYAEILRGKELVKSEIYGKQAPEKKKRAERVTKRMNFQYQHELEDWEEDHDRLILAKNIFGTCHKKYVWCKEKNRIECVLRLNGVVINDNVAHLAEAPRVTDEIDKYWWECEEKFRSGEWKKIELTQAQEIEYAKSDKIQKFYEQLRREDVDEDGYPEPYVVTVHEPTKQVVCMTPNYTMESITHDNEQVIRIDLSRTRVRYVKYSMIPSYEGGYWDYGFGILLSPLNDNCNALVNQLLDAGTLANRGGGFMSSVLRTGQGPLKFKIGEWKQINAPGIDFKNAFFPLPVRDPSSTLFNLLGLLMDVLRELSSVTEVMSGEQPHANMAQGTILSLIEQGKKVFNSIYKRHYASLKKEFLALFDLNFLYEDPDAYMRFNDLSIEMMVQADPNLAMNDPQEIALALMQGDFERKELDVLPTANPEFSSRVQRMAQAQAMLEVFRTVPDTREINRAEVFRDYATAITDDEDTAARYVPERPNMTPEQVAGEMEIEKQKMLDSAEVRTKQLDEQIKAIELKIKEFEFQKITVEAPAKAAAAESKSDSADLKAISDALAVDLAQKQVDKIDKEMEQMEADKKLTEAEADLKRAEAAAVRREGVGSSQAA